MIPRWKNCCSGDCQESNKMNFKKRETAEQTLFHNKTSKNYRNKEKMIAKSFISY